MSLLTKKAPLKLLFARPVSAFLYQKIQNQRHLASASDADHKLYELRTYFVKPDCMVPFVKLTNEHIHLRLSHSKLIGYWMTDLGGLNEVVHIWEYDNFAQRTAVRAALANDAHWQQTYFQHILKMMYKQDNVVMKAIPDVPIQSKPRKEGGIYELRRYVMKPGGPGLFLKPFLHPLSVRANVHEKLNYAKLIGAWMTEIGNVNAVYHLWSYESLDQRTEARHVVLSSEEVKQAPISDIPLTADMTNKILLPMPFSPLK